MIITIIIILAANNDVVIKLMFLHNNTRWLLIISDRWIRWNFAAINLNDFLF